MMKLNNGGTKVNNEAHDTLIAPSVHVNGFLVHSEYQLQVDLVTGDISGDVIQAGEWVSIDQADLSLPELEESVHALNEGYQLHLRYPALSQSLIESDASHGHRNIYNLKAALIQSGMSESEAELELSDMNKGVKEELETTRRVQETGSLVADKQQFIFDEEVQHAAFVQEQDAVLALSYNIDDLTEDDMADLLMMSDYADQALLDAAFPHLQGYLKAEGQIKGYSSIKEITEAWTWAYRKGFAHRWSDRVDLADGAFEPMPRDIFDEILQADRCGAADLVSVPDHIEFVLSPTLEIPSEVEKLNSDFFKQDVPVLVADLIKDPDHIGAVEVKRLIGEGKIDTIIALYDYSARPLTDEMEMKGIDPYEMDWKKIEECFDLLVAGEPDLSSKVASIDAIDWHDDVSLTELRQEGLISTKAARMLTAVIPSAKTRFYYSEDKPDKPSRASSIEELAARGKAKAEEHNKKLNNTNPCLNRLSL